MDVSICECRSYDAQACRSALEKVLEPLGGLSWVQPGMKIAVKANLVAFLKPDAAATTHPALLSALTGLLRERGAEVIVGDSPGGIYNSVYVNRVYAATGMKQVERSGARLNQNFSQKTADAPEAMIAKSFQYTAWLDECDAIIDFCKLKSHGMMAMSAAAKNLFGVIPGTLKPEYHFKYPDHMDFARMLVDLNEYFRPRLCIVDAVVGMEGNGPTMGTPRPIGAILAGESPHRVDLACAKLLGYALADVPTLQAALERGLIPSEVESLTLSGTLEDFIVPDFQRMEHKNRILFQDDLRGPLGKVLAPFLRRHFASRPQVEKEMCIGCRKCAEICPAKAITMRAGRPKIDRGACIRCFCCQEFCPKGAMQVARPPLAKLLNK